MSRLGPPPAPTEAPQNLRSQISPPEPVRKPVTNRNSQLNVKITEDDHYSIKRAALEARMGVNEYIVMCHREYQRQVSDGREERSGNQGGS